MISMSEICDALATGESVSMKTLEDTLAQYVQNAKRIEPCGFITLVGHLRLFPCELRKEVDEKFSQTLEEVFEEKCVSREDLLLIAKRAQDSVVGRTAASLAERLAA